MGKQEAGENYRFLTIMLKLLLLATLASHVACKSLEEPSRRYESENLKSLQQRGEAPDVSDAGNMTNADNFSKSTVGTLVGKPGSSTGVQVAAQLQAKSSIKADTKSPAVVHGRPRRQRGRSRSKSKPKEEITASPSLVSKDTPYMNSSSPGENGKTTPNTDTLAASPVPEHSEKLPEGRSSRSSPPVQLDFRDKIEGNSSTHPSSGEVLPETGRGAADDSLDKNRMENSVPISGVPAEGHDHAGRRDSIPSPLPPVDSYTARSPVVPTQSPPEPKNSEERSPLTSDTSPAKNGSHIVETDKSTQKNGTLASIRPVAEHQDKLSDERSSGRSGPVQLDFENKIKGNSSTHPSSSAVPQETGTVEADESLTGNRTQHSFPNSGVPVEGHEHAGPRDSIPSPLPPEDSYTARSFAVSTQSPPEPKNSEEKNPLTSDSSFAQNDSAVEGGKFEHDVQEDMTSPSLSGLSSSGACREDIASLCYGEKDLVHCLSEQLKKEEVKGTSEFKLSSKCKQELRSFGMAKKIARACKSDIKDKCSASRLVGDFETIMCLRKHKDELSQACQEEVFVIQRDAASDYKLDPLLNDKCTEDASRLCESVPAGGGLVQACLVENLKDVSHSCSQELLRQEREKAHDVRLIFPLYKVCLDDEEKFCKDVIYGDGRVQDCLENHRLDSAFSPACKKKLEETIASRIVDPRLNPWLFKYCKEDAVELCDVDLNVDDEEGSQTNWEARLQCLKSDRANIQNPRCKKEIYRMIARTAEDHRFDYHLSESCRAARTIMCKNMSEGTNHVLRCLQDNRASLDDTCRSALFDMEVQIAEDIDFIIPMKRACSREIQQFCSAMKQGWDTGHAVVECLQEQVSKGEDSDMSEECRKEVKRDELLSAQDYRLNYEINKECYEDINKLCRNSCSHHMDSKLCGGTVLKCLTMNLENLHSKSCQNAVFTFEKKEAANVQLDVPLQNACKGDLLKLCSKVSKDHSQTLSCLRSHHNKLSPGCQFEELRFSIMEASDIRLTPSLMNACGPELNFFCRSVAPNKGVAFKCLQLHLSEVEMGAPCKGEVNLQELRHASDYRLDVRVRSECQNDVATLCADVSRSEVGHASGLKCFVSKFPKLSGGCQTEVAYAVRMALWQYGMGASLTAPCDAEVGRLCHPEEAKEFNKVVIGVYGQCLVSQQSKAITNPECRALVKLASKEGAYVGYNYSAAELTATLKKLEELRSSRSTEGWPLAFMMMSVTMAMVMLAFALFRKFTGPPRGYTLVVKGGDV